MDETFQQSGQLAIITAQGYFLSGLILPPGSTLPTKDIGPIAMGGTWYFWDPSTNQYLPQSSVAKSPKNFVRNSVYQIGQNMPATGGLAIPAGITPSFDMAQFRASAPNMVSVNAVSGPVASPDNDTVISAAQILVGPSLNPTPGATDLYCHEHLLEGIDIIALQGQILSLSFSFWTPQAGTYSVYLANSARDHSYVTNFTITPAQASSWVRIKINSIPAFPVGSTWSFAEGVTGLYIGFVFCLGSQWQTPTPNQWVSGIFCGTSANSNLLTVVNNQCAVTGIKLEAATAASYLMAPPFSQDYEEMTRYFFTTYSYQSATIGTWMTLVSGLAASATGSIGFPRRMAKIPNVVPYSPNTNAAGTLYNVTQGTSPLLATINATAKGANWNGAVPAAAKGDVLIALIRADARLS